MEPIRVGLIGCGNISDVYFRAGQRFHAFEVAACADIVMDRAKAKAKEHGAGKALTVPKLLADPAIDAVLNLTVPKAHGEIALQALDAGKSVYNEKPLAVSREEARKILNMAQEKGLHVGCAPDTFLGAGLQTCRKLIDDGWIGEPVAATAFMACHGHEHWHPGPDFFYQPGGGPLFDMGPYYLTALVTLLGPVRSVSGMARISFPQRVITSKPHAGNTVQVNTPTHVTGLLSFERGPVATIIMSFDVWAHTLPHIEIHGAEGSLSAPDPNTFGGPVRIRRKNSPDWHDVPLTHEYADQSRGLGLADMAVAIRGGRPHRASGALAYHVLDIMHAFHDASNSGRHIELSSGADRPPPMPMNLRDGEIDGERPASIARNAAS